jgi:hypothetical protein
VLLPLVNAPLLEYTLEWLALNQIEEVRGVGQRMQDTSAGTDAAALQATAVEAKAATAAAGSSSLGCERRVSAPAKSLGKEEE